MAQAEGRLLAGEAGLARGGKIAGQGFKLGLLAPLGERSLELELNVEMILDHSFVTAGNEYEMLDAGSPRFINHMLYDRPVDNGQHLLRHGFRRRKEPRAEARNRKHSLSDLAEGAAHRVAPGNGGAGWDQKQIACVFALHMPRFGPWKDYSGIIVP
jgi:hypothetical protein